MLTAKEIGHIAKLAKLELTEAEVTRFCPQLTEVLDYIKILAEVPTDGVNPTFQVTGIKNIFRAKGLSGGNCLPAAQALRNARVTDNQYFVVPPVLAGK